MIVHEQTGINFLRVNDKTQQLLIVDHRPGTVLLINELDESIFNLQNNYFNPAAAAAKSLQSYPTLCDPIDGSPPGSAVPGILQARTLEWVAISFSNA